MAINYQTFNVRPDTILTNSFVSGTIMDNVSGNNQNILYIKLILGSLTQVNIKMEFSDDKTNWYQETVENISGSVFLGTLIEHSFATNGNYRIAVSGKDKFVRVSSKGTGTITGSSLGILGISGNL